MSIRELEKISVLPERESSGLPEIMSAITPMAMLSKALASGASMEVLEKLMALSERWDASQARKAFDEAVAAAKAEIKPIVRNATGHNSKKYADFAAVATAIDPILSKNGLSYRFRAAQADKITVTCILSHKSGHSEETPLSAGADKTGNKNDIQAIGSALTYLQRYSLMLALGLSAANDDDGKSAGRQAEAEAHVPPAGSITQDQADQIRELLESRNASPVAFLQWAKQKRIMDIPAEHFDACVDAISKFRKVDK